ncbi:hypothetical protein NMY22_g15668 [Coprinellus aureogranulatus]|nr:hypothetical protein NMY22_g15668 [Coprinellus aureogranulatus]
MLTSTFTLQFKDIMELIEALDYEGMKTPLDVAMAMGRVGITCEHDTSFPSTASTYLLNPSPDPGGFHLLRHL